MEILTPEQLKGLTPEQLQAKKTEAESRKAELAAVKAKGGKAWTAKLQDELNSVALFLVDVDDAIAEQPVGEEQPTGTEQPVEEKKAKYQVAKGTEKLLHLKIVKGRRFSPRTGKEISKPYIQMFTHSEWQLYKKNFARLGYTIVEVLHDPYKEAKDYVTKD